MKLRNRIISTVFLLLSVLSGLLAAGQSLASNDHAAGITAAADRMSGVMIEKVVTNSEGEKAGLQEGDVLLYWSRGTSKGEIESPFDVSQIEIEQAPRGSVTLEGLRGAEKRVWTLGPSDWGFKTRPNLAPDILSLYQEGANLAKAGKLTEAAEHWDSAAKLHSSQPAWVHVWLLLHTADAFTDARQWKEGDDAYQEAIQRAAQTGSEIKTQLLWDWAKTFQQRGEWAETEKHYQEAAEEDQKTGSDSLIFADALDGIGMSAFRRGDITKAEHSYSEALEIQKKLAPGSLSLAKSFNGLGNLARVRGDLAKAEEYHRQALAIREKLVPSSPELAGSLGNLGTVAWSRGDLATAEEYDRQALLIQEKLAPGSHDVAMSLNNLGLVAWTRGDLGKAEEYYRGALMIDEKLFPGGLEVAGTLNNLGILISLRGDLAKAEECNLRALTIEEKLAPNSPDVAYTFINLGSVAWTRGDLVKAEEYYHQALGIYSKLKSSDGLDTSAILNNLGVVARNRGDLVKAEEYHNQALAIKEKLAPGSLDLADSLNNLGLVAQDRGHLAEAEEKYHRALEIEEKLAPGSLNLAESLNNLGDVASARGDLATGEEYYRRASTIREKLSPGSKDHAETLAALAKIMLRKGQLDAAAPLFDQALKALESQTAQLGGSEDTRSSFRAKYLSYYHDYIDLLIRQKQPELAFQVLERSRAQTLLEMLVAAHINVHKGIDPALLDQERSRAADITAKTNRRIRLLSDKHAEEQVTTVDREIDNLLAQHREIDEQIRASSPGYAALTQPQPLTAKDVQQLLDDDTLLLEYSLSEDRSYVFAVTPNSLDAYQLPKSIEIEHAARHVRDLVAARNRYDSAESGVRRQTRLDESDAEYDRAATALSQMVLGPVTTELQQKRLLIVADGALQYISFAALPSPSSPPASGRVASQAPSSEHGTTLTLPLVVGHEIVNLPAASVLAVLRREAMERKPAPKAVAVLADPVFARDDVRVRSGAKAQKRDGETASGAPAKAEDVKDDGEETSASPLEHLTRSVNDVGLQAERGGVYLPRLLFSRREATTILSVTPPGQGMEALDFQASRTIATSPDLAQYRVVHFATHGLLDNEHPELSGLVFSLVDQYGKPQNGFVELQDIYNLKLSADLVVLSACETGLGKEVRGEGLIGLTRGFMYAGANRVVASLWSVDDVATAELMGRFYQAMEQQGMRPAAALRQAQLAMLKQERWSSPYYWAGFVIQGEWR
jgi:CHAT domain-containing protein/Tfp pilus assembly protein PilF